MVFSLYPMEEYINGLIKNIKFDDYNTTTNTFTNLNKFSNFTIDVKSLISKINEQNKFYEYHTNELKEILDNLTDIMENESLLSIDRISELIQYININKNFIASNIKL